MKRYFFSILVLLTVCNTLICADTKMSDILALHPMDDQIENPICNLKKEIIENFQGAAKLLSKSMSTTNETHLVTYETVNGILFHIGWYEDSIIVTALNGVEQGKQVIIINSIICGISYDIEVKGDYFFHKYTWGKIYSYNNHQVVKINK